MIIEQLSKAFIKAWTANANTSSFASRIPTITEPTNDGVFLPSAIGSVTNPLSALILPYGLGANDDAFDMKVIGWRHIGPGKPQSTPLWVPTTLGVFSCIMGNVTGAVAAPVLDTEFFCDVITAKSSALIPKVPGYDGSAATTFAGTCTIYSPNDDTVAYILVELLGVEKLEIIFDQTTNAPTMNALVSFL